MVCLREKRYVYNRTGSQDNFRDIRVKLHTNHTEINFKNNHKYRLVAQLHEVLSCNELYITNLHGTTACIDESAGIHSELYVST